MYGVTRAHTYVPRALCQRGPSGLTSQARIMYVVTRARTYVPRAKVSEVRRGAQVKHTIHIYIYIYVLYDSCAHLRPSRQSRRGPSGLTNRTYYAYRFHCN